MAAFTRCMCLTQRINSCCPQILRYVTADSHRAWTSRNIIIPTLGLRRFYLQIARNGRLYSTVKQGGVESDFGKKVSSETDLGSLTSGILSSKMKEAAASSSTQDGHSDQSSGDTKEKDTRWSGKNAWKLGLLLLGGWATVTTGVLINIWGAPAIDPEGNEIKDEFSDMSVIQAYLKRAMKEFRQYKQMLKDPSRDKLLPDPLQYPYMQPPYTLVMEMTGVMVHPDWTYGTGWRFKKRPGLEYFLQQVGPPLFEIVIYTSEQGYNADPILNNLDPNGYVMYRLYRDATRYIEGHHVKDLSCLNRDLSKVIIIDWNKTSTKLQEENRFLLKRWVGADDDRTLIDLANFLRTLSMSGVEDVRSVLQYYNQFEDPIGAFRENQRLLQEEQDKQVRLLEEQEKKKKSSPWMPSLFGRR